MRISAGNLRLMGVAVPQEIPDCAETEMPEVSVASTSYDEARRINVDLRLDFSRPFEWVTVSLVVRRASVSRNKREGKFIGRRKMPNGIIRYRQGNTLYRDTK
jgi:hypothetical protein